MNILGINHSHDAAACLFLDQELVAFCKEERLDRVKNSRGSSFRLDSIKEVLEIGGIAAEDIDAVGLLYGPMPAEVYAPFRYRVKNFLNKIKGKERNYNLYKEWQSARVSDPKSLIDEPSLLAALGLRPNCRVVYCDHHYSHILALYRYTDWTENALYVSNDGKGDGLFHTVHLLQGGKLRPLLGEPAADFSHHQNLAGSLGMAYGYCTELLGFMRNRHEGKVTGLAAFGKPIHADTIVDTYVFGKTGIRSKLSDRGELREFLSGLAASSTKEDMAASIQEALERVVLGWLEPLVREHDIKYIGMNGGIFANVKLNQRIAAIPGIEEVHVTPPMSDEGLSVGNAVNVQAVLEGFDTVKRSRLRNVYLGRDHPDSEFDALADEHDLKVTRTDDIARTAAEMIHGGKIGAIYTGGMEMGPRALGARSIIASPIDKSINDSLNERLSRTEFMPFAPVVRREDAEEVFDLSSITMHAATFMTITTDVHERYKKDITAAVHVDNTARPQVIEREDNPLYFDILTNYKELSGIPCLINTSFNAHEEPIINTPAEAVRALVTDRVDFLVMKSLIVEKK